MTSKSATKPAWDRATLRRRAGSTSFERGEAYFKSGRVKSLVEAGGVVTARVVGTRSYRVRIKSKSRRGRPDGTCSCPIGQGGNFCKHLVAVGLARLDLGIPSSAQGISRTGKAPTLSDIRAWLDAQESGTLVDLILEQARDDDRLRSRLFLKVAKTKSRGAGLEAFRRALDQAIGASEDFESTFEYTSGVDEAIDPIDDLLKAGRASEAMALAEYGLEALDGAMDSVDDSYGNFGNLIDRLQTIHLKACRKAKPDPKVLARKVFAWELQGNALGGLKAYSRILGKPGLAEFRALAESEWAKVPVRSSGRVGTDPYPHRYRITRIMETLADLTGDVENQISIRKRDLSSPQAYLRIAEACRKAGKHDAALEWAEKGVKAHPGGYSFDLQDFLAQEYHRRKRHDLAMDIVWKLFLENPTQESYRNLKVHSDRAASWETWRPKALDHLRERIAREKRSRGPRWTLDRLGDHSELVRILLWEKDLDTAWKEAKAGGCAKEIWLELARKRESSHPADAIEAYQRMLEPTLAATNKTAYREALDLLKKVRKLMVGSRRKGEFITYLATVKTAHRQKRSFIKLLDGLKAAR